jgi:hypothetical protein
MSALQSDDIRVRIGAPTNGKVRYGSLDGWLISHLLQAPALIPNADRDTRFHSRDHRFGAA